MAALLAGVRALFHNFALRDGTIKGMGAHGVKATGFNVLIEDLRVMWNGDDRIEAGFQSVVKGNALCQCAGNGIVLSFNSLAYGNTIRQCALFGISMNSATSGYGLNVMSGNNSGGAQTGGGVDLGGSLCGTNTTCP